MKKIQKSVLYMLYHHISKEEEIKSILCLVNIIYNDLKKNKNRNFLR